MNTVIYESDLPLMAFKYFQLIQFFTTKSNAATNIYIFRYKQIVFL